MNWQDISEIIIITTAIVTVVLSIWTGVLIVKDK